MKLTDTQRQLAELVFGFTLYHVGCYGIALLIAWLTD